MSFVRSVPESLGRAANNLAGIGSTISASNASAAAPTVAVSAAAGDQVSAAIAAFFSGHARGYQAVGAQAAQFHTQFVQALGSGANTYAAAEAANASPFQQQLDAPVKAAPSGNVVPDAPAGGASVPRSSGSGGAVAPSRTDGAKGTGGSSATETSTSGPTGAAGGVLLRAAAVAAPNRAVHVGVSGGAGGLLSRLVGADGDRGRSGAVGRVSAGVGVGVLLCPAVQSDAPVGALRRGDGPGSPSGKASRPMASHGQPS